MRGSIRRTLLIYGLIASGLCALGVTTYATQVVSDVRRHEQALPPQPGDGHSAPDPYVRHRLRMLVLFSLGWAAALGCVWGWLGSRVVLAPLKQLSPVADAGDTLAADTDASDEVDAVARSFRRALRAVTREKEEVELRNAKLTTLQVQLAHADKLASIGHLAAGIAHDVGNPLAAVMGYLHILRSGVTPEIQADVLTRSIAELERIHTALKGMLAYARPETTAEAVHTIPVTKIVTETVDLVRAHPDVRRARLTVHAPEPLSASGHERALAQIVANLVINAGQATRDREDAAIDVRVAASAGGVEVVVEDNGPGIAKDAQDKLFTAFFTTKASGTGLGLSVSASLAQRLGGTLTHDSTHSAGARFRLALAPPTKIGTG